MTLISSVDHTPIRSAADASGDTVFAFRTSCSYRLLLEEWYRDSGVQPHNVMEIQSYHAMMACVASGAGVALIPESVLAQMRRASGCRRTGCRTDSAIPPRLIWRRDAFTPMWKR